MAHGPSETKAHVAVLTVSDSRILENDTSGNSIVEILLSEGHVVSCRSIVKDEASEILAIVTGSIQDAAVQVIIVTGGTGASKRDSTPDVVEPLFSSTLPGFGELFRSLSFNEIGSAAMLSRAEAGWVDYGEMRKPIFLLPGATNAVRLALTSLIIPQLGHLLDVCNEGAVQ